MPFKTLKRFGKGNRIEEVEEPKQQEINSLESICSIIKKRRSVRKYQDREVKEKIIENILDSAACAPSAGNYQPWEFIVVRNQNLKNDLAEASYNQKWIAQAPVLIVACMNCRLAGAVYGERGLRLYGIQAVAAAIQNILLTAESLGLGTCWVGAFSEIMVSRIMQCPDYVRAIFLGAGTGLLVYFFTGFLVVCLGAILASQFVNRVADPCPNKEAVGAGAVTG